MEPLLDGHGSAAEPTHRPSLLDLPDELVTLIFRVVYLLERDEKRTGTAVSLNRIRVNRRIYALAFPVFLAHIRFPVLVSPSVDAFFGGLLQLSRYMLDVKSIKITDPSRYPNLTAGVLVLFTALKSLEITSKAAIPVCITRAISQLANLQSLSLRGRSIFEDRGFSLSNATNRQFSGTKSDAVGLGTAFTLEMLEFDTSDLQVCVPWAHLRILKLTGKAHRQRVLDSFGSLLRSLTPSEGRISRTTSLIAFEFAVDNEQPLSYSRFSHFEFLFDFLRRAKPKHIKLSHISDFPFLSTEEVFPFVHYLELQGSAQVSSTDNLEALHSLLSRFPSLEHLTLTTLRFNSTRTSLVSDYTQLSYAAFVMSYPIFTALLTFLRTTTILHFEYEPPTELLKLRGTRTNPDENLSVEVIRMLRK